MKKHKPHFTQFATSNTWESEFGRSVKQKSNGIKVKYAINTSRWLFDVSDTKGKAVPTIYGNFSGKVEQYQDVYACLAEYSTLPIEVGESSAYYTGVSQDARTSDGKIILRTGLSEQQTIFALVREIVAINQSSKIIIEAASYIVCKYLGFDTSVFSYGYLLELMDCDVEIKPIKYKATKEKIICEAELILGYLNSHLDTLSDGVISDDSESILEAKPEEKNKHPKDEVSLTKDEKTETINGIDFKFLEVIKGFQETAPDRSLSKKKMQEYSYNDSKMWVIGHSVAIELYSRGCEIYRLFKENNEALINDKNELDTHHGLFGIAKVDWTNYQAKLLEVSVDAEKNKMSAWSNIVAGTVDEGLQYNENGQVIVASDDINHDEVTDSKWLETALPLFFKQTGYKQSDVPYFANRADFVMTGDMKKINKLMAYYCAFHITHAIKSSQAKSSNTGKLSYNLNEAVRIVCNNYTTTHIIKALDTHLEDIKITLPVKRAFQDCFLDYTKGIRAKPKKPTFDEQLRRIKAKDKVQAHDNESADAEQSSTGVSSDKSIEILHIIEDYKKGLLASQKKQVDKTVPLMPTAPPPQKRAR